MPRISPAGTYVFAVAASATFIAVRLLLPNFFGTGNWFIQSHPAVLLSAWVGGLGPGLVATGLSATADAFLFMPPQWSFRKGPDVALILTFCAIGALVSSLVAALRNAREVALRATQVAEAASRERERLLMAAEEANRAKDEFLATLSHELRTPLNAVLGWAHILMSSTPAPQDYVKAAQAIHRNCELQKRLVDDLLDFSAIVSGKLSLRCGTVDLSRLVREVAAGFSLTTALKSQRLDVAVMDCCTVSGDADRLGQVVWNLLSNAAKFSPDGSAITVRVTREAKEVVVSVADGGIGIDAEFLPHMFEAFRQSDSSTTRAHGGLGLGLALVQRLVEGHGGSISAKSPGRGGGTTVEVRLPAAE